ncbi:MerR family transcriptional regulator [Geochorda subterranea]|uniref:MerR family transcriptional regulator n=1 Tax=Geochorda subterranea TaxID=3109564 RepID=A0ABZ1BS27_9FIRM|nr:MerR family transcriptional regulator [Limnochorda sp. LNt]WRP15396.1 MerR family transcriptional regulator [Limnochorda sp. LNt]
MPGVDPSVPVYPIGVVQRLTGLSARQIRYYEKEGLLAPSRSRGNRRLYSVADVERLRHIKSLLQQGLNLEGVRSYLAAGQAPQAPAPAAGTEPAAGPAEAEVTTAASGTSAGARPEHPLDPAIFRQARGRRLSSLFPVDRQAELVSWLEEERQQPKTSPTP